MNKCGEAGEELKKIPKNESMLGMMDWKKHVSLNQYVQLLVLAEKRKKKYDTLWKILRHVWLYGPCFGSV